MWFSKNDLNDMKVILLNMKNDIKLSGALISSSYRIDGR